jgi:hypothetical protein
MIAGLMAKWRAKPAQRQIWSHPVSAVGRQNGRAPVEQLVEIVSPDEVLCSSAAARIHGVPRTALHGWRAVRLRIRSDALRRSLPTTTGHRHIRTS